MNIIIDWFKLLPFDQETQNLLIHLGIFIVLLLLSIFTGRYTPQAIKIIIAKLYPTYFNKFSLKIIKPLENLLKITGTLILILSSLYFLKNYQGLYNFFKFWLEFSLIIVIAWMTSRFVRQIARIYGINLIQKLGREVDELLLVVETIINILIGFFAAITLAQKLQINLVGLFASVGLGGLAIAFAAQKTLEQLIGTLVLYLDRPYLPGEYIRVNFNIQADDVFARVESIGLRSTKLRIVAKGTLLIVPNSIMASKDIENISRGKKIMVLLYLDFVRDLSASEKALVEKVVKESTNALFGIDPDSTKIVLYNLEDTSITRARITFFILGSSEDSVDVRKRLLELANDIISQKLQEYGIHFQVQEPTVYVESPVTI